MTNPLAHSQLSRLSRATVASAAIVVAGLLVLSRTPETRATSPSAAPAIDRASQLGAVSAPAGDSAGTAPEAGPSAAEAAAPLAAAGGAFRAANLAAVAAAAAGEAPAAPHGSPQGQPTGLIVNTSVAAAVRPGARLHYTVRYTNTTASTLSNIVIRDTLSTGQDADGAYFAEPVIPGAAYTWNGLEMTWNVPSLAPGNEGLIMFETIVHDRPEPSAQQQVRFVGNTVRVNADGQPEREDQAVARVIGPILELTLADGPDPVLPGHFLAYTLTLRNLDRADSLAATGIVISAVVPTDLTFEAANGGGSYDPSHRHVVWSIPGPLEPGGSLAVSYSGRVDSLLIAPRVINVDGTSYVVRADQIQVNDVPGRGRVATTIEALLQKTADGPRTIVRGATAFPGDVVTYTVTAHNPGGTPLAGMVISDTLPGLPGPFQFRTMLSGPAPTVNGAELVWRDVSLPAWGRVEMVYTALVPRNTFISDNATNGSLYGSNVTALTPDFPFPKATNVGQVRVFPPITMNKIVQPAKVQAGETVVYTITLQNRATEAIGSIRLTDTMKGTLFRYTGMLTGPMPEVGLDSNPVVWDNLSVPAGGTVRLAFSAFASGFPLVAYDNHLAATTPHTFIPSRSNLARVTIDSPFRIEKTVTPRTSFMDANVRYAIGLSNVTTMTWVLDRVTDTLPAGVFDKETGRGSSVLDLNPPAQIRPGESWQGAFDAYVSGDVDCNVLPRDFPNMRGKIALQFSSPIRAVYGNAADLAPLRIRPNVSVYITPTRQSVLPGGQFVYNIRLHNESGATGTNSDLKVTAPAGFSYLGPVSGPAPIVNGREMVWENVQIGPRSDTTYQVRMQATDIVGQYGADFDGTSEGIFCIQRLRNLGKVDVRQDVVLLTTRPLSNLVPPGGPIDFELKINNYDQGPFLLDSVTNVLPPGFEFVTMVGAGTEPTNIDGRRVSWSGVTVGGKTLLTWRLRARASTLYGAYQNTLEAESAETMIRPGVSSAVEVVPMVQISKAASVTTTTPGSTFIYTVTMLNQSAATYSNVIITDTLPIGLSYEQTLVGPAPNELGPNRASPVWRGLSLGASGGTRTLVFSVRVDPNAPEGTVFNKVEGYSPNVTIPGTDSVAPVFISRGGAPVLTPTPYTPPPPQTPPTPGPSPTATVPPTAGPTDPGDPPSPSPTVASWTNRVFMPAASQRP